METINELLLQFEDLITSNDDVKIIVLGESKISETEQQISLQVAVNLTGKKQDVIDQLKKLLIVI